MFFCLCLQPLFVSDHRFSFTTLLTMDMAVSCPEQLVFVAHLQLQAITRPGFSPTKR
jgi:hypothetical protein